MPTMMQESTGSCNVSGWGTLRSGADLKTQIQKHTNAKYKKNNYKHIHKYKMQKDKQNANTSPGGRTPDELMVVTVPIVPESRCQIE